MDDAWKISPFQSGRATSCCYRTSALSFSFAMKQKEDNLSFKITYQMDAVWNIYPGIITIPFLRWIP